MILVTVLALVIAAVAVIEAGLHSSAFRHIQSERDSERRVLIEVINELRKLRPFPSVTRLTDVEASDVPEESRDEKLARLKDLARPRLLDEIDDRRYVVPTDL